ncbi:MAG: U32 family peptidase, partial [Bacillota bacterium]|nr:U32 family peptidase [Bacillota bacterium]
MDNDIELLAPAGDWDAFLGAVENGADAVYLGSKQFNARQNAGNFDRELLSEALKYARVRGVKVYLALNTLILDNELQAALKAAEEAYILGIDGFIVQDMGFAKLLRKCIPDAPLHASTQMTVYNVEGLKVLEELGFKRAVLARELSLQEIKNISENTTLETEIFIHGALCVSYSGQCLMSSIIGGRSGNRGKCAQPCRLPYELTCGESKKLSNGTKGYLLSPKDLNGVSLLNDIVETGVKSLKIEGRMKQPEYVATVVRVYRKYLDLAAGKTNNKVSSQEISEDTKELMQVFNRGGFSTGYLKGKSGKDMMCYEKPKNWGIYIGTILDFNKSTNLLKAKLEDGLSIGDGIEVWNGEESSPGTVVTYIKTENSKINFAEKGDIAVIGDIKGKIFKGCKIYKTSSKSLNMRARETFSGKTFNRKLNIKGKVTIKKGCPVSFKVSDSVFEALSTGNIPQAAINKPITKERVLEQAEKTGNTPFVFTDIEVELDLGLVVPISEINNLRREALEKLHNMRSMGHIELRSKIKSEKLEDLFNFPGNGRKDKKNVKLSLYFYEWKDFYSADLLLNAGAIYIPFKEFLKEKNVEIFKKYREMGCIIYAAFPAITRGNYDKLIKSNIARIIDSGCIDGVLLGNIGHIEFVKDFSGIKLRCDHSFNILNSLTLSQLRDVGVLGATLSPELNLK